MRAMARSSARRRRTKTSTMLVVCGALLGATGVLIAFAARGPWEVVSVLMLGVGLMLQGLGLSREGRGVPRSAWLHYGSVVLVLGAVAVHFLLA